MPAVIKQLPTVSAVIKQFVTGAERGKVLDHQRKRL
jgi:hypothetical protein